MTDKISKLSTDVPQIKTMVTSTIINEIKAALSTDSGSKGGEDKD